jgi:MoaA/NifB/PqqE/SkfB family radical SAM enzyme
MCIRNTWNEPQGIMSEAVFSRIMDGLRSFSPVPKVFFGGFGEPLVHPRIIEMIKQAKSLGASVELITNATLLTKELSLALINAGLDMLWVSLDGAKPESYADIRLGAVLPQILENLAQFREAIAMKAIRMDCFVLNKTKLGIAFVAMKRNIADLPAIMDIGRRFGAEQLIVTNVLPYTKDMVDETLYNEAVVTLKNPINLRLPRMDFDPITFNSIYKAISKSGIWPGSITQNLINHCPFIANGCGAVRWDGNLSPCLPLLHEQINYRSFAPGSDPRASRPWSVGNVLEHSLPDLWNSPEHIAFRKRVEAWEFSPCTNCGGCDMQTKNEEDCYGNNFPTCGGCLWAQGVVQCP